MGYTRSREAFLLVHFPKRLPDVLIFFLMFVLLILLIFPLISSILYLSSSLIMIHSFIIHIDYLMAIWWSRNTSYSNCSSPLMKSYGKNYKRYSCNWSFQSSLWSVLSSLNTFSESSLRSFEWSVYSIISYWWLS